jgi:hypothetical protein
MAVNAKKSGYRSVSLSLYTPQTAWLDLVTQLLVTAGYPKANRSLVVQEAVMSLQEQLRKSGVTAPDDVAAFFRRNAARRRRGAGT